MGHFVHLAYLVQFGSSAHIDLAHLVQLTPEARRRYSWSVVHKVPVVHLVHFGQNCSVGISDSKYPVAAIFALPVWPLEPLKAGFPHILADIYLHDI